MEVPRAHPLPERKRAAFSLRPWRWPPPPRWASRSQVQTAAPLRLGKRSERRAKRGGVLARQNQTRAFLSRRATRSRESSRRFVQVRDWNERDAAARFASWRAAAWLPEAAPPLRTPSKLSKLRD